MSSIRLLPPDLSARIAAGEVVERPASAVKELVENALDAGATRIAVELTGGGLELILVSDNGCGIPHADTELLFQPHATSKLDPSSDLSGIATLGFRGEALYSLASVAQVSILTRAASESTGTFVAVEISPAGAKLSREPRGAPLGTTVTARRLFARLPARRKFMRSPQAEAARVQSVLGLYVLAYPEVAFSLVTDGQQRFASPGSGDVCQAMATVHGAEVASSLLPLESPASSTDQLPMAVTGLVSPPELTRASRNAITILVNRRPVQNRSLVVALEQAYQGFLPQGRHPVAVLNVLVPYEHVDVNVHPAKAEVRFRDEGLVFSVVQRAVRRVLAAQAPVPLLPTPSALSPAGSPPPSAVGAGRAMVVGGVGAAPVAPAQGATWGGAGEVAGARGRAAGGWPALGHAVESPPNESAPPVAREALPLMRVLGQTQDTYIVAEGPQGVYLVDQHAAHERVQYERLRDSAARRAPDAQALLNPESVDLSPHQQETLVRVAGLLEQYGWRLEEFGAKTMLVRAIPSLLVGRGPARALTELLEAASAEAALPTWEERLAATMACHGSVRAGQTLSLAEMTGLLAGLQACKEPQTCPHGRPTMLHLSSAHLERQFRRR